MNEKRTRGRPVSDLTQEQKDEKKREYLRWYRKMKKEDPNYFKDKKARKNAEREKAKANGELDDYIREQRRLYMRDYYKKNSERIKTTNRERYRELKNQLVFQKAKISTNSEKSEI